MAWRPFHIVRMSAEYFALTGAEVRLRDGSSNLGQPSIVLASLAAPAALDSSIRAGNLRRRRYAMRSDLVFKALSQVTNRYQLCQLASKATRKLHKPNTRLQDTTNEVLCRFQTANPEAEAACRRPRPSRWKGAARHNGLARNCNVESGNSFMAASRRKWHLFPGVPQLQSFGDDQLLNSQAEFRRAGRCAG